MAKARNPLEKIAAEKIAKKLNEEAQKKAEKMRKEGYGKADKMESEANAKAETLEKETDRRAQKLIDDAKAQQKAKLKEPIEFDTLIKRDYTVKYERKSVKNIQQGSLCVSLKLRAFEFPIIPQYKIRSQSVLLMIKGLTELIGIVMGLKKSSFRCIPPIKSTLMGFF
jgi:hypothetical protein